MNNNLIKYKAAIWDIYGTILIKKNSKNNNSFIIKFIDKLLQKHFNIKLNITKLNILKKLYYFYIDTSKNNSKLKGIDYPEVVIEKIWQNIFQIFFNKKIPLYKLKPFAFDFENMINPVKLAPDIEKVLLKFKLNHIKNGIISNCQFYTFIILNNEFKKINPNYNIDYFFHKQFRLLSYKTGYCKPSLFLFNEMKNKLSKFNIKSNESLYIGNTAKKDVVPSSKLGFKPVLITPEKNDKINNKKKLELFNKYDIMHFDNFKMML